jgi:hypothetical protein
MDPSSIALLVGLGSLLIERVYKYMNRAKKSKFHSECCGIKIDKETENK